MLETFDTERFRRELAGLCDVTSYESEFTESCKANATNIVELIAVAFNRDTLDAVTLWDRTKSAIQKAIEEAQQGDMIGFMSICLNHVMAEANTVVGNKRLQMLQEHLYGINTDEAAAVVRYLSTHLLPCIVFGKKQFEDNKTKKGDK